MLDNKMKNGVSAEWYKRLENCKNIEDVDALSKKYAEEIKANDDLRRLVVVYKMWLKRK